MSFLGRMDLLRQTLMAVALCGTCIVQDVRADDAPERAENGEPLIVRDVSVYLLSAYGTKLNDRELFQTTLPGYTLSRRPTASRDEANTPIPAGIITFSGPPEEDIDVLMEFEQGRVLTHWPPGRLRSKRLLWAGIDIAGATSVALSSMADVHWLTPLRSANRLYAIGNKHADRFLLYDAELPFAPHVTLKRSEGGYDITNTGKYPVHDVAVYRPVEDGEWEIAATSLVEAASAADEEESATEEDPSTRQPASPAQPASAPQEAEAAAFASPAEAVAVPAAATTEAAQQQGDTDARPKEKPPVGTSAPAAIVGRLSAEEALQSWRETLAQLNLQEPEYGFILQILQEQAFRRESAMLVYRLDEAHLENLLPLEVTPYPDRVFRVALVIVQDADPDLQTQVERLVAQLGDDEWKQREAAQQQLSELGLAAKPKLEAALSNKDAEIVFRAEQLLESLKATP